MRAYPRRRSFDGVGAALRVKPFMRARIHVALIPVLLGLGTLRPKAVMAGVHNCPPGSADAMRARSFPDLSGWGGTLANIRLCNDFAESGSGFRAKRGRILKWLDAAACRSG